MEDHESVLSYLLENLKKGDILLTLGAGNVYQLGETLVERLSVKGGIR